MLTDSDYKASADRLKVTIPIIKAIAKVESRGEGFLPNGKVKILYEPYQFGRLTNHRFDGHKVNIGGIEYPLSLKGKWNAKLCKYGSESIQWSKLEKAKELNNEKALEACSWGQFQIMGFNYFFCGFRNVFEYVKFVSESSFNQLMVFTTFLISSGLSDYLKDKKYNKFFELYNGKSYKENKYDEKFLTELKKFEQEFHNKYEKYNFAYSWKDFISLEPKGIDSEQWKS